MCSPPLSVLCLVHYHSFCFKILPSVFLHTQVKPGNAFHCNLDKSVDAWVSGSRSQEVNTLWECVCVCSCVVPTVTRLAKGLPITFPQLPSVTSQKIVCVDSTFEAVAGAKWDHQPGWGCWDLDQIVGLRIKPVVCIESTLRYGTHWEPFLSWAERERQWAEEKLCF